MLQTSNGSANTTYVYGLDCLASMRSGSWTWSVADALGSTRLTLDDAGRPQTTSSFDPWGQPTTGILPTPFGFTGEWQDTSTGLVNLRARWYQPQTGRFLGRDPFEGDPLTPHSLHQYAYTHNNPINFTDPSGMYACNVNWLSSRTERRYTCGKQSQRLITEHKLGALGQMTALDALTYFFSDNELPGGSIAEGRGYRQRHLSYAAERLEFVLWHTASPGANPMSRYSHFQNVAFNPLGGDRYDSGFAAEFQDGGLWPGSSRQVGHFLTAVHLAYDNLVPQEYALNCIIGHELIADGSEFWQCMAGDAMGELFGARRTFLAAVSADIAGDRAQRECLLRAIDPTLPGLPGKNPLGRSGNSIQDMRLSLKGWIFGKHIRQKTITTLDAARGWLTTNLAPIPGI